MNPLSIASLMSIESPVSGLMYLPVLGSMMPFSMASATEISLPVMGSSTLYKINRMKCSSSFLTMMKNVNVVLNMA